MIACEERRVEPLPMQMLCVFFASRLLLAPEDVPARPSKTSRRKRYRLKPEERTVRSPYIEAIEANYAGEYDSLDAARQAPLNVRRLRLRGEKLTALPTDMERFVHLHHLTVERNTLQTLGDELGPWDELTFLNAMCNQISTLPASIGQLCHLHYLKLSTNRLTSVPEEIGQCTALVELALSWNQIEQLPDSIGSLSQLHHLGLAGNQLKQLPDALGKLTQLEHLSLHNNQIETLPDSIGNLSQLRTLWLRSNRLKRLPESLGQLTRLEDLDLAGNQLEALPDSLDGMTKLTSLSVTNQQLRVWPECLSRMTWLTHLNLQGNQIERLPDSISELSRLVTLNLGNNQLETLPASLSRLTGLYRLDLRDSPRLTALPAGLSVRELLIAGCRRLATLPDDITVTHALDLGDTALTSLPPALRDTRLLWRGVPIDQRIAFHPETITVQEVFDEPNAERRRVLLGRVGLERFLRESGAEVLDQDRDHGGERRLLRVRLHQDEPLVGLSVIDPSTGRQYILRVPPGMRTCHQAAAWIAGFDNPDDYHPLLET
jgi:Leucine-rich repeat (LRR) protein